MQPSGVRRRFIKRRARATPARAPGRGEPAAVHVSPELPTGRSRPVIESTVGPVDARDRLPEVVGSVRNGGLFGHLGVHAVPRQVVVEPVRGDLVADDRLDCGPAHVELAAVVVGRPDDRLGRDLGLEDRRHRLGLAGQPALHPIELGRVERGHLDHGEPDPAAVVDQLASERVTEALDGVLGGAVGRLERDAAVGQRRADLDDDPLDREAASGAARRVSHKRNRGTSPR